MIGLCKKLNTIHNIITCNPQPKMTSPEAQIFIIWVNYSFNCKLNDCFIIKRNAIIETRKKFVY